MDKTSTPMAPPFPARIFGMLAAVSILLACTLALTTYTSYRDLGKSAHYLVQLEHTRSHIIYLDELLTLSAIMAASSSDPTWAARYDQHKPQLAQALQTSTTLATPAAIGAAPLASIRDELTSLEVDALLLVENQRSPQALNLLTGDEYIQLKSSFTEKVATTVNRIRDDISAANIAREQRLTLSLLFGAAFSLLLAFQVVATTRKFRQWRRRSDSDMRELAQAKAETQKLNQTLERRVTNRTEALETSKRQLYSVLDGVPIILFALDANGICTLCEGAALATINEQPGSLVGQSIFTLYQDAPELIGALHKTYAGAATRTLVHLGNNIVFNTSLTPIADAQGTVNSVIGVSQDVSGAHDSETRLHGLSQAVEQHPAGIAIVSLDGTIQYVNPRFGETMGQDSDTLVGSAWHELRPKDTSGRRTIRLRDMVKVGDPWKGEFRHQKPDGASIWLRSTLAPLRNKSDDINQYLYIVEDISEQKQMSNRLNQETNFDNLTGLPNRKMALECINAALDASDEPRALVLIDLDNFKRINDGIGHDIGDRLLADVGKRIRACVNAQDTIARIGGDEFLVLVNNHRDADGAGIIASHIVSEVARPYQIDERSLHITASAGVALAPQDGKDAQRLLRNADTALYQAKAAGRNTCRFFSAQLGEKAEQQLALEDALRGAIAADELTLHYQPIIDLPTGRTTRVEALLRWNSTEFGNIPPDVFIPLAEHSDLIVEIDNWVLNQACKQAHAWRNSSTGPITIGVNLSPRQFLQEDFAESVLSILQETGARPEDIELEITERLLVTDQISVTDKLRHLDRQGVKFCIDDFGTGYSSLAYLKHYPIDTLKIDRIFVRDVVEDPADAELAAGIIKLAHGLSMRVTGEGVETAEQLEFLRSQGCDLVQGYFFSKPLPAADFISWLDAYTESTSAFAEQ